MLPRLALVPLQVLVAAQAEPVGARDPCVFGVVVRLHQLSVDFVDLLLEVDQVLLDVLGVSLLVQEDVDLVDLVPEVDDLLVDCVGSALLLLEVADEAHQVGTLVVQLVVEVLLEVFDRLGVIG